MRTVTKVALAALVAASAPLQSCVFGRAQPFTVAVPRGLELYAPVPEDNPLTQERVELGSRLFFDATLSADRTVACASCHQPALAFADSVAFSRGAFGRSTRRNTPSLLNAAYQRHLTWDGRSSTLEEQVLKPIQDPDEMDLSLEELVRRLEGSGDYRRGFQRAFRAPVSADGIARALATYLRTLRSGDAPIDRFKTGDSAALNAVERKGFEIFVGKARCAICHAGPTLSDGAFHNTGVSARSRSLDTGRHARTGIEAERAAFRTPSLRNVAFTAPYMHDGSITTLEDVIEFYDGGGEANPNLDPDIRSLGLTAPDKDALLTFLRALSSAQLDCQFSGVCARDGLLEPSAVSAGDPLTVPGSKSRPGSPGPAATP